MALKKILGLRCLVKRAPELYRDLVYKLKKKVSRTDFSDRFKKVIMRYKHIGYKINVMRQSAFLVINQITDDIFASLFNCMPVGRASNAVMGPT